MTRSSIASDDPISNDSGGRELAADWAKRGIALALIILPFEAVSHHNDHVPYCSRFSQLSLVLIILHFDSPVSRKRDLDVGPSAWWRRMTSD